MLPRHYRLKERRDFLRVYRRGTAVSYPAFVLHWHGNSGGRRIGFSVSRKCGNAVERNRVKRRFRHAAMGLIGSFPPARDYIFVVRRAALNLDYPEITAQMGRALNEIARSGKPGKAKQTESV